ncbi:hypothetical protein GCM10010844_41190 [Deinococcus radiotolerans]|uniref:Uncharacterized protein n=1 Tax=Deinococcus radiotolerans TaxID=1309407 RepID=A0ABQ2FR21_9DEIO|nr:hypothetical protein GCM10010844_41190 [Deinococcus radiotolerans]
MECDLAVERGFDLEDGQKDFREPSQRIEAATREMGFEVGGQCVGMESGSIGDRLRPRCRPLSRSTAFGTPFLAKSGADHTCP